MTRLTKAIADKIKAERSATKFLYFGEKEGYEFYQALRSLGGKCGFPLVFGIDINSNVKWVEDYDTLSKIQELTTLPELIQPV